MAPRFASFLFLLAGAALADESPMSLTASDGSGLALVRLEARAVVQDPLAFTELRLVFHNPEDRVREGQFRITLPPGAAISRFAMKLDERWQEGEVVEKEAARRAYEDFLHRRQDPALLEQSEANEFSARVFPIAPRANKELVVSFSQTLPRAGSHYALFLKGLPRIGELDVEVTGPGLAPSRLTKKGFVPDADFEVAVPPGPGLRAGELSVFRLRPVEKSEPAPVGSLLLLVDTSASRALGFGAQLETTRRLLAALAQGRDAPLTVAAFDQDVEPIYAGTLAGFGAGELARLKKRRALGASNLERALTWAAGELSARPRTRVLLVTDGVVTAGATDQNLVAAALALKKVGVERIDALAVGGLRDESALRRLTTAGLAQAGVVLDAAQSSDKLVARLFARAQAKVTLAVSGSDWSWPTQVDGVQAGDEVLVFAAAPLGFDFVMVNGQRRRVNRESLTAVERPLLERACAQARIEGLLARHAAADGAPQRSALKQDIVKLSVAQRVLSPFTALLVLETEDDYRRYGIARQGLADILLVREGKVVVKARKLSDAVVARAELAPRATSTTKDRSKKGAKAEEADGKADESPSLDDSVSPKPSEVEKEESKQLAEEPSAAPPTEQPPPPPPAPALAEPEARPAPATGVSQGLVDAPRVPASRPPASQVDANRPERPAPSSDERWDQGPAPYSGKFHEVMAALAGGRVERGLELAQGWREEAPGDVLALVALGEAAEKKQDLGLAARAYGSIIDLFPSRTDLRRFAAARLERVQGALALAADSYARAVEQRPDHPGSHRLLAYAWLKLGEPRRAFEAIAAGLSRSYPDGRFRGARDILAEDAGLIAAAWIRAEPARRGEVLERLKKVGGVAEDQPSLRFVLTWETDANDVDFHIGDGRGGHAFYSSPNLPSGGRLYADVTTGYGPECFTIRAPPAKRAYPYRLRAHYYSRGPMGYGMGKLQLIEHDGQGGLRFEERPYVVMVDRAFVDLGQVTK